jgi:hypothetical protein
MSIVRDLVGQKDPDSLSRKDRKDRASRDFEFFCNTYLPHYFSCAPAEYQKALYEVLDREAVSQELVHTFKKYTRSEFHKYTHKIDQLSGIIDIEPRDHGKSVRLTFAYPLWCILYEKRKFIALFGNTDTDAKQYLENIKNEVEDNELILEDFGEMKGSIWKANMITFSNGTAIAARGKGSSARGLRYHENRPDLVILDDVIKDEEADSKEQCDKIYRWIKRVVFNLGKDCLIFIVNTHFNDYDPPTVMLNEALKGKLDGFLALRFSAELEDGTPIWPERWSMKDLEGKRKKVGSTTYMIEYLSLSVSEEDKIFRSEWIVYVPLADIEMSERIITMGVDPNATGSDDASIAVCAYDKHKKYRDIVAWWSKPYGTRREFVERLIEMYQIWQPIKIGFEEVAFQKIYKEFILEASLERGIMLPVVGIKPGSTSKKARVMQLQPYVETGIMRFSASFKGSVEMDRLLAFPTAGVNDGIPDAVYYAVFSSATVDAAPYGVASRRRNSPLRDVMRRFTSGY